MIRFSDHQEYLEAVPAALTGDFATARSCLESLLAKIGSHAPPEQLAHVLQLLADVEAQAGCAEKAQSLHERALAVDSASPLTLLNHAKSLLRHLRQPAHALAQLQAAESLLGSGAWQPGADHMSREWYQQQIQMVPAQALQA